jgi:formylmethanofuran dehydrogenase subunit E
VKAKNPSNANAKNKLRADKMNNIPFLEGIIHLILSEMENIMICQQCGERIASVKFTQIINGEKSEILLCSTCASESNNISFNIPFNINDFFR